VGNATSDGIEIDGEFQIAAGWNVNFGLSYIEAELTEDYWVNPLNAATSAPDAPKGTELPRVPDLKWNVSSRYNFMVKDNDAFVQASYTSTGESYNLLYRNSATRDRVKQDSYEVLNLAFGVETDDWSAEIFVANATDERGEVFVNGASYDERVTSNRPRTIGLRFRQMFN
jgi:outer membrane receptor protein involved in Fe transport